MTNTQRLETLKKLREALRDSAFRTSIQFRQECLEQILPLLNFNGFYYSNAIPVADILSRPGFSSMRYDHAFARMDSLIGQAIAELEHGLTPAPQTPFGDVGKDRPTITITNSNIGILNTGQVENIGSIAVHVQNLSASGHPNVAEAFKSLAETIAASTELSSQTIAEALEQLDELARQASTEPASRSKLGVLKSVFHGLATTLGAAGRLAEVWATWGHVIQKFFGF
ncbi:MAG: hypothetical protein HY043_07200 [Verrucomicrobia bacterium]|nr:hypothetical protein [Verrucomicrobiota bacterium]